MKYKIWGLTGVILQVILSFVAARGGDRIQFKNAAEGVFFFDGEANLNGRSHQIFVVKYKQNHLKTKVVSYLPEELDHRYSGKSLLWFFRNEKAKIAISGGFLKTLYPPLPIGFVKTEFGILSSEHYNGYQEGYVGITDGRAFIERFPERKNIHQLEDSKTEGILQSWPLLLYNGNVSPKIIEFQNGLESTPFIRNQAIRLFVASDKEGFMLFGMTGPMSLLDLTVILKTNRSEGGLGCNNAINLSGTKYASIILETPGVNLRKGSTSIRIANAIVVY